MNLLNSIGTLKMFKEFVYPTAMDEIEEYIRNRDPEMYKHLEASAELLTEIFHKTCPPGQRFIDDD
jgi:hypothetical protein